MFGAVENNVFFYNAFIFLVLPTKSPNDKKWIVGYGLVLVGF